MKTDTIRAIIRTLENTASTDVTRNHLNCAKLSKVATTKDTYRISACDGHIMSHITVNDDMGIPDADFFIHREKLPLLKLLLKEWKNMPAIPMQINGNHIYLNEIKVTEPASEFKYPNLDQLTPSEPATMTIGLDADLLLSLAKVLNDSKKTHLKLEIIGPKNPVRVSSFDGNSGVIMPVRI